MGVAAHIARLRTVAGHVLLLLPSVSVLPVDDSGRILLVRHAGHDDGWGILGGPDYEVTYPNGDRTAYVTAVYEARRLARNCVKTPPRKRSRIVH